MIARCGEADPFRAGVNTISNPPGEYDRKVETQSIDGGPHKQWSMWFNSKQREEPYQNLTSSEEPCNEVRPFGDTKTGVAWLSSARVVRC